MWGRHPCLPVGGASVPRVPIRPPRTSGAGTGGRDAARTGRLEACPTGAAVWRLPMSSKPYSNCWPATAGVGPEAFAGDYLAESVVLVNPVGTVGVRNTGALVGEVHFFRWLNALVPMGSIGPFMQYPNPMPEPLDNSIINTAATI